MMDMQLNERLNHKSSLSAQYFIHENSTWKSYFDDRDDENNIEMKLHCLIMSCETQSIIVFCSNRSKLINKPDVNNKMKWYVLHATTDQNNQK